MNTSKVISCIDAALRPFGFIKKRDTWYRQFEETTLVFNLQKAEYGGEYFVNLGIALNELLSVDFPKEQFCQLRMRINRIVDDGESALRVFNLENRYFSDQERCRQIGALAEAGGMWLLQFSTKKALAEALRVNRSLRNHSVMELKELLKLPLDE